MRADIADWGKLLGGSSPQPVSAPAPSSGGGTPSGASPGALEAQGIEEQGKLEGAIAHSFAESIIKLSTIYGRNQREWERTRDQLAIGRFNAIALPFEMTFLRTAIEEMKEQDDSELDPLDYKVLTDTYTKVANAVVKYEKTPAFEKVLNGNKHLKEAWEAEGRLKTIARLSEKLLPEMGKELAKRQDVQNDTMRTIVMNRALDHAASLAWSGASKDEKQTMTQAGLNVSSPRKAQSIFKAALNEYRLNLASGHLSKADQRKKYNDVVEEAEFESLKLMIGVGYYASKDLLDPEVGASGDGPDMAYMSKQVRREGESLYDYWGRVYAPNVSKQKLAGLVNGYAKTGRDLTKVERNNMINAQIQAVGVMDSQYALSTLSEITDENLKDLGPTDPFYGFLGASPAQIVRIRTAAKARITFLQNKADKITAVQREEFIQARRNIMETIKNPATLSLAIETTRSDEYISVLSTFKPNKRKRIQATDLYIESIYDAINLQRHPGRTISEVSALLHKLDPSSKDWLDRQGLTDAEAMQGVDLAQLKLIHNSIAASHKQMVDDFKADPVGATMKHLEQKEIPVDMIERAEVVNAKHRQLTGHEGAEVYLPKAQIENIINDKEQQKPKDVIAGMADYEKLIDGSDADPEFKEKFRDYFFFRSGIYSRLEVFTFMQSSDTSPNSKSIQRDLLTAIHRRKNLSDDDLNKLAQSLDFSTTRTDGTDATGREAVAYMVTKWGMRPTNYNMHWLAGMAESTAAFFSTSVISHFDTTAETTLESGSPAGVEGTLEELIRRHYAKADTGEFRGLDPEKLTVIRDGIVDGIMMKVINDGNFNESHIRRLAQTYLSSALHDQIFVPQLTGNPTIIEKDDIADSMRNVTKGELAYTTHAYLNNMIQRGEFIEYLQNTKLGSGSGKDVVARAFQQLVEYGDPQHQSITLKSVGNGWHHAEIIVIKGNGDKMGVIIPDGKGNPIRVHTRELVQLAAQHRVHGLLTKYLAPKESLYEGLAHKIFGPSDPDIKFPLTRLQIQNRTTSILSNLDKNKKHSDSDDQQFIYNENMLWTDYYLTDPDAPDSFKSEEEFNAWLTEVNNKIRPIDSLSSRAKVNQFFGIPAVESVESAQARMKPESLPIETVSDALVSMRENQLREGVIQEVKAIQERVEYNEKQKVRRTRPPTQD